MLDEDLRFRNVVMNDDFKDKISLKLYENN